MNLYILDTDCLTLFQKNHPIITQRVKQVNPAQLATTAITMAEQLKGWLNVIHKYNTEKLIAAYQGLEDSVKFYNTIEVISFDTVAYQVYQNLKQQKVRIGTQDLRIASIVIAQKGILVTRNSRDFEKVPNLKFEDWTIK